jgi:hypothetical protein
VDMRWTRVNEGRHARYAASSKMSQIQESPETRKAVRKSFGAQNVLELSGMDAHAEAGERAQVVAGREGACQVQLVARGSGHARAHARTHARTSARVHHHDHLPSLHQRWRGQRRPLRRGARAGSGLDGGGRGGAGVQGSCLGLQRDEQLRGAGVRLRSMRVWWLCWGRGWARGLWA